MIMVDELRVWPHAEGIFTGGSAHLTVTDPTNHAALAQLHDFARAIGMRRKWFQNGRVPHYDLTPGRRARALAAGAVFVDAREQARMRKARDPQNTPEI